MFYNPDKFDVVIVILKFLSVLSSGLLAGETFYASKTHMPGLLATKKVDNALSRFRYLWPKGLQMTSLEDFRFLALFLRYFILFDRQMFGITSHMHNDLSEYVIYLCVHQIKTPKYEQLMCVFLPQHQTSRF